MEIARPTHPQCSHFLSLNRCSHLVVDSLTYVSVWCTLEHAFASLSNSQIMQLHSFLQDLRQDDDNITLYLQKANGLFDELAIASRPISPIDFNLYIFRGLCGEFRDLVTSLSTKAEPLPYFELHGHLSTHEFLHRSSFQSIPTAAPCCHTCTASLCVDRRFKISFGKNISFVFANLLSKALNKSLLLKYYIEGASVATEILTPFLKFFLLKQKVAKKQEKTKKICS